MSPKEFVVANNSSFSCIPGMFWVWVGMLINLGFWPRKKSKINAEAPGMLSCIYDVVYWNVWDF